MAGETRTARRIGSTAEEIEDFNLDNLSRHATDRQASPSRSTPTRCRRNRPTRQPLTPFREGCRRAPQEAEPAEALNKDTQLQIDFHFRK